MDRASQPRHIDHHFDEELAGIRRLLLQMGGKIEEMIDEALRALETRDTLLARRVEAMDQEVDDLEKSVDAACIALVARRQPAGSDLRFVAAVFKSVTDLERVGDLAVNMCERVEDLNREAPISPRVDVARMAQLTRAMLADSLDAFVRGDVALARDILMRDDQVDELNVRYFEELSSYMAAHPSHIRAATAMLFVVKHLERIADHATNLAQMVVYQVEGRDIRHSPP